MTHPFVRAWEHRDADRWRDDLAPDVALFSPVLTAPFAGRDAVVGLYRVLFEQFGEVVIGGVAPAVARPRGRGLAFVARALTRPVRPLFRVIDAVATRLSQR